MVKINMSDVYKEYWDKMLYQLCWKYTNNRDEAKDLCQNGFLRVYNNLHKYKEVGSFEGWIRKIIKNSIIDYQRKKKLPTTLEATWEIIEEKTVDTDTHMLDTYDVTMEDVIRVKEQLPTQKLKVFNLILEGYKHKEIAEELGISESTSKTQFHRSKQTLRKILLTKSKIK